MPQIDLIPEVLHSASDPYHWIYDNLPLNNILARIQLINDAADNNSRILQESVGSTGSLSARLAQALNDNGSLRQEAVDATFHNIASHQDGTVTLTSSEIDVILNSYGYIVSNPVLFVKMLQAERAKLAEISSNATALKMEITTPSNTALFSDETIQLNPSDSITWDVSGSQVTAHMTFPTPHSHYYDIIPSGTSPNYTAPSSFIDGTLRVYVNGVRIPRFPDFVYVPKDFSTTVSWTITSFDYDGGTDPGTGDFILSRTLDANEIITIDFNHLLA